MALDILYTSAGYNAYTDIAGMDLAMLEVGALYKNTFWSSQTDPVKEALIKAATKAMNKLDWLGTQNTSIVVSSMDWPRIDIEGVGATEIPEDLKLRMACWITHNAASSTLSKGKNVASKSVGDVSITYRGAGSIEDTSSCDAYGSQYLASLTSFGGIGSVGLHRLP